MPIIRTYACEQCGLEFEAWHDSGNEPNADCPVCVRVAQWRPQGFAIGTNNGRAVDLTQQILEQDYGVTDFNDGQREGDTAGIVAPETSEQRHAQQFMNEEVRKALNTSPVAAAMAANDPSLATALKHPNLAPAMRGFWGNSGALGIQGAAQLARAGAAADPLGDVGNPLTVLHNGLQAGEIGEPVKHFRPIYRDSGSGAQKES